MKINLRDYYPVYHHDAFVEVDDKVIEQFKEWEREENRRRRTMMRHNAYYTLNYVDCEAQCFTQSAEEAYECKQSCEELYAAIANLPENQRLRILKFYFRGMSITEIARNESVGKSAVTRSIQRGLVALQKEIENKAKRGGNI